MKDLQKFKKKFDLVLNKFYEEEIKKIEVKDKFTAKILKQSQKITMSGGKRIRPALMYYGYLAYGGKKDQNILKTTATVELLHAMFLIQDDIIDKDDFRHNVSNIHIKYGVEYAITVGGIIFFWTQQIFLQAKFTPKIIFKALQKFQEIGTETVIGENNDVKVVKEKKANLKDIFKIYEYKTAKYTLTGPFQLGAILAGIYGRELHKIEEALLPIGIAFQIQDDILGIFSIDKKIGKPVGSDIREGKQTILTVYAFQKGNSIQKNNLKKLLGKEKLTKQEINLFKQIMEDTGALENAQKLVSEKIKTSKEKIEKLKIKHESKKFLLDIADYMLTREV